MAISTGKMMKINLLELGDHILRLLPGCYAEDILDEAAQNEYSTRDTLVDRE